MRKDAHMLPQRTGLLSFVPLPGTGSSRYICMDAFLEISVPIHPSLESLVLATIPAGMVGADTNQIRNAHFSAINIIFTNPEDASEPV